MEMMVHSDAPYAVSFLLECSLFCSLLWVRSKRGPTSSVPSNFFHRFLRLQRCRFALSFFLSFRTHNQIARVEFFFPFREELER